MAALDEKQARLDLNRLPRHVAIIMDGNGRWAQARGLPRLEGHREASKSVRAITRFARRLGIRVLTLYTFSSENWKRPVDEVTGLMSLFREFLISERAEIMDNGIRLTSIGDIEKLPNYVREPLDKLSADSASNSGMTLCLALSYGGRSEILRACKSLVREKADPESIDAAAFESRLFTRELPDPDMIIRTSGERRISNFLLWQAAYAELIFTDTLWPDFREESLVDAIIDFQSRERRFGLIGEQVRASGNTSTK